MSAILSRCRWIFFLSFLLLLAVPVPLVARAAATPSVTLDWEEQTLWQLIRDARAGAGLPAVAENNQVVVLARERSTDMVARHYFDHYAPDGQTFLDLMPRYGLTSPHAGETLQENNRADSAIEAARALIASPEHHAVLFDARYTIGGVGHAVDGNGVHYFTMIFVQA